MTAYFSVLSITEKFLSIAIQYVILTLISIFALILFLFGIYTTRRDYDRFLEFIAYIAKIEHILGLYQKIKLPLFPKDDYLFQRFVTSTKKYASTEDFIKNERNRKGNLFYSLKILYYILILIFLFLLAFSCYHLLALLISN